MDTVIRDLLSIELMLMPGGQPLTVGRLVAVLALLVLGYVASRLVGYFFARKLASTTMRPDAIEALRRVAFYTILILVVLTALGLLQIPLAAFAFVTGAVAIGIGFGAQNIINNVISGWILMAERPIRIGDFVELDGAHGTVERIGNRSTRIRRTDGVHLLVPNSQLLERSVTNWTLVDNKVRTVVRVGVAYGSPIEQVRELMLETALAQSEVLREPAPVVIFEDFGDSALVFDLYLWCETGNRELRQVRSDIRFRINQVLTEADIVIAFPQRDVHVDFVGAPPAFVTAGSGSRTDD